MIYLPVYELGSAEDLDELDWFNQLRQSSWPTGKEAEAVSQIIKDVEEEGDRAVVRYMQKWTDPDFDVEHIRVSPNEMATALGNVDAGVRKALELAIENVRAYQAHIMPTAPANMKLDGAELGLRFSPVRNVALTVPGGKAAYPSTVVMLAVPAIVAGVSPSAIHVLTPPPTKVLGKKKKTEEKEEKKKTTAPVKMSPLVLATCGMLGIQNVYRIGGAQGIAAAAVGTKRVPAVDMIVGPGNIYTQQAKLQLNGRVGIDGFYGPSEILTIADDTADPAIVAADLIAQAEHDPGRCFVLGWSHKVIGSINEQIEIQLTQRRRYDAIVSSLKNWSAAILVTNKAVALRIADRIAAEHVNLAVKNPDQWLKLINNGGEYFLGDSSPVAAGDYIAGPSHCLPTGTTSRYASGVSVYTFLKRASTVYYRQGMSPSSINAVVNLAHAEGLDGHQASVRMRARQPGDEPGDG